MDTRRSRLESFRRDLGRVVGTGVSFPTKGYQFPNNLPCVTTPERNTSVLKRKPRNCERGKNRVKTRKVWEVRRDFRDFVGGVVPPDLVRPTRPRDIRGAGSGTVGKRRPPGG